MASLLEEDIFEKDFKILPSLGCGSLGEVMFAKHLPTCAQLAVKALQKAHNTVVVTIHKSLQHYNIIQFFYAINTLNTMYVVMEYLEGKDLEMVITEVRSLKEKETRPIFSQLASTVHFLHQRRIAHCDIKLENILLGEGGKVKLCDFEFVTQIIDNQMFQDLWGSLPYWVPGILARKPYDGLPGNMWSLGVVLYAMVTRHFPYEESTIEAMYRHITNIMCPISNHLTKPCYIILARLLMVYVWFRLMSSLLVKRPCLGHIEEHITLPDKEILHKVLEVMCNIGYTCKQVVSSLQHLQSNNLTATMNIIKFKLSSGDSSSLQNIIPAVASSLPDTMKRRHSESALLRCRSNARLHTYSCPEVMHYSDNMVLEKYSMTVNTINPAAGDNAFSMNSVDSLSDKKVSEEDSLTTNTINPTTGDNAFNVNSVDTLSTKPQKIH
ncbi:sperm motility kinase-like [Chionomys nivalis]|uniref:sperm motility kinase-like n=1 Tax=Chionomys nivalis TaxID=269649 RepID=UPI0025978FDF|nr:sperm motility kinase-like [Chionomys nivalis]